MKELKNRAIIMFLWVASCFLVISVPAFAETVQKQFLLDTVVVTGTKTEHDLADVPVQTYVITNEEIAASDASSLSELLKGVPGFNFTQQANLPGAMGYKNTVRGLNVESRYLFVLVDGRRVFTGFRAGVWSVPASLITSMLCRSS